MPLALEPGEKNIVWLDVDADKPIETRPVFFILAQSMRGQMKFGKAYDDFIAGIKTTDEAASGMCELLASVVVGWKNMFKDGVEIPYSQDAFLDILTLKESQELVQKVLGYSRVSSDEKKSSESQA
jgi:hypothetical protein